MTARTVLAIPYAGLHESLAAAGYRTVAWPKSNADWQALVARAPEIDAVITIGIEPLTDAFAAAATNLRIICCLGAGYDTYDPKDLARRGIKLVNSAGVNADDVAELAFGLLIAARRQIVEADKWVRDGRWPVRPAYTHRLRGSNFGILGLGSIGRAVAARAEAFGMPVGWHGPRPKETAWPYYADLIELADWADILCVCCRPTPENTGVVGEKVLNALGPKGILVNVARGSLVDEPALISALREGRVGAAGLDVYAVEPTDPRQWEDVPNLTLHPHRGGTTFEAIQQAQDMAVENLRRFFAGEPVLNPIN
jgi:lactate dehydrogenase-like 2-hydroxyacid dehydrogenase